MDWDEELAKARQGNQSSIRQVLRYIADALKIDGPGLTETQRQHLCGAFNRLAADAEAGIEAAAVRAAIRYFIGSRRRGRVKSPDTDARHLRIFHFVTAQILGGLPASRAFIAAGKVFHRSETVIARIYYRERKKLAAESSGESTDIL